MSPLDASFLHVENDVNHMHIASVAIFEGPAPPYQEIVDMVASKLHLVPRYRQLVRFVPLDLERPVWVDNPHFNLQYHIRHTALPAPGSEEQLRNLVGRVMAQQLDRAKPLWEMWVVDGLEDARWAVLSKTHHCMVDGVSATDLLTVVMDASPEPARAAPLPWEPEEVPTDAGLLAAALRERLFSPAEMVRSVRSVLRGPRRLVGQLREFATSASSLRGLTTPSDVGLNGPIGPHRRWNWARTSLEDVKRVRRAFGGTVNDVVLTAITKGFRELLLARGQELEERIVRSLVPVSVRRQDERGGYNNRVSAMFAELPVGIEDPLKRLESIARESAQRSDRHHQRAGAAAADVCRRPAHAARDALRPPCRIGADRRGDLLLCRRAVLRRHRRLRHGPRHRRAVPRHRRGYGRAAQARGVARRERNPGTRRLGSARASRT
jgi:WS/DGAT/MGAT family acyltransferase